MKIAFKTYGCKANSVDTDALHGEALKRGFEVVGQDSVADAYVINSCTVTSAADRDARLEALHFKRQNPLALVAVVGCYAQVAKDELLALPEIDFVVGTANKHRVLDHFAEAFDSAEWNRDRVEVPLGYLPEYFPGSRNSRAPVKVQDGCNFSCSFCIIPKARGRSRSLPVEKVLAQVDEAYRQGFQEIVLTGIHLAHYGWDLGTNLMTLLAKIFERQGPRIRVSTLDPFEIPDEMIALLGREPRFCPHFHIALQSGSDKILSGMRRIYKAREFNDVTGKIQAHFPRTFIGLDVIVGFPGEGEIEFAETVSCLEQTFWTKLHVFPFSARKGTRAELLPEKVRAGAITERSARLREMSELRYSEFLASEVGTEHDVLLERPSHNQPGFWLGHTENYLPTLSKVSDGAEKKIIRSRAVETRGERLVTEVV